MEWLQIVTLALLQGLTEFLPVSSSAHLILLPVIAGWSDQGLAFDVAVHVGTLCAVMLYFRHSLFAMARDGVTALAEKRLVGESRLALLVVVATLPVIIGGLLLGGLADGILRAPLVIALTTIVFGLALFWASRRAGERGVPDLRLADALVIGLAQVVAIIPGTSRSGITMTAGMLMGLSATASARFSFLLSIPTIALAGGWKTLSLVTGMEGAAWWPMVAGALLAGVAAYLCIGVFLALVARIGMTPFVVYRLALGVVLLWVFL